MTKRKFWLWVDGRKRYYDYPPEPPGYTLEQMEDAYWMALLARVDAKDAKDAKVSD